MAFDFPTGPAMDEVYMSPNGIMYRWNGYAWIQGAGAAGATSPYVLKIGDVMTGPLTLNADPTAPLVAATKQYVDNTVALPPTGTDGQALVAQSGNPVWGAPIDSGNF